MKTTEQLQAQASYKDMKLSLLILGYMTMAEDIHSDLCDHEYDEEGEPLAIRYPVSNEVYGCVLYLDEMLHANRYLTHADKKKANSIMKWVYELGATYK